MALSREFIKRTIGVLFAGAFVMGLLFMVGCDNEGEDPEPELYDLSGVYIFKEATLQSDITITIGIPITVHAGRDITEEMSGGLLAEAPCKDPENGAVELKANNELFFACIGESNEAKAGSWSVDKDRTELTLSLASPPLPSALALKIENLDINETADVIGGSIIKFPLTPDLMLGFLPASMTDGKTQEELDVLKLLFDPVTQVDVFISFQKITQ